MIDTSKPDKLEKEFKLRKAKIIRDILGAAIVGVFIVITFLYEMQLWIRTILVLFGALYLIFIFSRMKKSIDQYYALTEDLIIEDGYIIKRSGKVGIELLKVPFDDVIKVYTNIKNMPNTIYVLFEKDGELSAENFYKYRVKDSKELENVLKKRNLISDEPVSLEELKKVVE